MGAARPRAVEPRKDFEQQRTEPDALAQTAFGLTDEHLHELARNSFEPSFLPPEKKIAFLNLVDSAAIKKPSTA